MSDELLDYRLSHTKPGKGRDYHEKFVRNAHRAIIWEIEQQALRSAVIRRFGHNPIRHLDFACGTGRILAALRDLASLSVGVDISDSMMQVAKEVAVNSELVKGDLTHGPIFTEGQFDVITAFRFFPNAQHELRFQAMRALVRNLAPGGVILFNNHLNITSSRYRVGRLLRRRLPRGMSEAEACQLAQSSGLRLTPFAHAGVLPSDERWLLMPKAIFNAVERRAAKISMARPAAQDIIYLCERADGRQDDR